MILASGPSPTPLRQRARGLLALICGLLPACGGETTTDPRAATQVVRVIVAPDSAVIDSIGRTTRFTATAYDNTNRVMERVWTWSVSPGLATIDDGLVTGLFEGRVRVVAATGAKADTAILLIVTP
jgi:hypothetical protein